MKYATLLLLISFKGFSQNISLGFTDYRAITDNLFLYQNNQNFNTNDLSGSVFLEDEFKIGFVNDIENNTKSQLYLRYDVYKDLFEIILDANAKDIKTIERSPKYEYFYNGEKFVLIENNSLNIYHYNVGNFYLVEINKFSDDLILYKRYLKKFVEGKKATSSYDKDKPPSLKDEVQYLVIINGDFKTLDLNKKKILDSFPDKYNDKLKSFIKKNKLNFRGSDKEIENELKMLVEYYSTL